MNPKSYLFGDISGFGPDLGSFWVSSGSDGITWWHGGYHGSPFLHVKDILRVILGTIFGVWIWPDLVIFRVINPISDLLKWSPVFGAPCLVF